MIDNMIWIGIGLMGWFLVVSMMPSREFMAGIRYDAKRRGHDVGSYDTPERAAERLKNPQLIHYNIPNDR